MATHRGIIRGFLAGVVVTLIGAGVAGYLFYKGIEAKISPEAIRTAAEETLAGLVQRPVSVGTAKIGIANNLLSMERVRISSATGTLLTVEKLEAFAEGGVDGLQEGRFARIVVTNPVVSLKREGGEWNLSSFLSPLLNSPVGGVVSDSTAENAEPAMPLTLVQVFGLQLWVTLENETTYSGVSLKELVLSRSDPEQAWQVHAEDGNVQLNPSADEWPLLEAMGMGAGIPVTGESVSRTEDADGSDSQWLADVEIENVSLELVHPRQALSVGEISFSAEDFFRVIRLRTGSLEKKSLTQST